MKTTAITLLALGALIALAPQAQAANGRVRAHGAGGTVAAGSHNGNSYVRGRGVHHNSDGSVTSASGGAVRLNNGATGARGSTTTVNPDGSVSHAGGFQASGAKGTVTSSGGYSRNADGTASGTRNTEATGAKGNSYDGTSTYNSTDGYSHSGSCHNAGGETIACPSR